MRKIIQYVTAVVLAGWLQASYAQTITTLVRSCPTKPTATGFSACANSQWSLPSASLIIDIQRSGVTGDVWITPSQLIAGDRVFACADLTAKVGAFSSCPTTLAGQTNNYLDATKISFSSTLPPAATGEIDYSWVAPILNSDGSKLTNLAGYKFYVRAQTGGTYATAIVLAASTVAYQLKNVSVNQCAEIAAYNSLGVDGVVSDEVCAAPSLVAGVPAKIVLTVK